MKTELEIQSAERLDVFRKKITAWRDSSNKTLEVMAEECEVSQGTLNKLIYSGSRPRGDSLCNIMITTGITL